MNIFKKHKASLVLKKRALFILQIFIFFLFIICLAVIALTNLLKRTSGIGEIIPFYKNQTVLSRG